MSELVVFNKTIADLAVYEEENKNLVFDYADEQGNKDARSHVYKLRKARSAFDKLRKDTKAEALAACKNIDSQAKVIREKFDAMVDVHEAPIKRIEAEEEAKKQAFLDEQQSKREKEEADRLADLEAKENELEELKAAAKAREEAVAAEAKAKQDEIDRIAREKKIAEDVRKQAEFEKQEAIKKAEQEAKEALERAEREKQEAIENAKRQIAEATEAKAKAELAETARLAKIEADRVADQKHRDQVEAEVKQGIVEQCVMAEDDVEIIMDALRSGKIPNVTINY